MATITPTRIDNRLGVVISSPAATTNAGPTTGDIGADGAMPTKSECIAVFDVTLTSAAGGDIAVFAIPPSIQLHASNPLNIGGSHTGLGLDVTIVPMNATARTGNPFFSQTTTTVTLTFAAAAAGAIYRVKFNAMHSITR